MPVIVVRVRGCRSCVPWDGCGGRVSLSGIAVIVSYTCGDFFVEPRDVCADGRGFCLLALFVVVVFNGLGNVCE